VGSAAYRYYGAAGHWERWTVRADRPQSFHIEGVMFQVRNVNGSAPFPEDRGWKDTVWVDGQVELLVYYGQPSWPHFPFQYLARRWSLPTGARLADSGESGAVIYSVPVLSGIGKTSFISSIVPAYNRRPF
jgi:suppressor of ftsI